MNRKIFFRLLTATSFLAAALNLSAQGTAFLYQGRLNDSGTPANTNYDFRFAVYDAITNGNRASLWLTNAAVPVANGLFTATIDLGSGVFTGSNYWLDIGVRATGTTGFTTLAPRQPILPVPYAIFATSANNLLGGLQSTQLVGRISSTLISGTYSNGVNFSNGTNVFAGYFSGNGSNLTSLNASQITSGTLADARLTANVALLNTNQTFTGTNIFTGPGRFTGANAFSGVNTFTNLANTFNGNFFGNGLVGWTATNSTVFTAQFDHGYLLTSPSLVTVTLPSSINVGDIIRVAGGGTGGWLIKCSGTQTIVGNFASYANCVLAQLSSSDVYGVACSADGVEVFDTPTAGHIYFTEYFLSAGNWNSTPNLSGTYYSIACSANGKIVYVEDNNSGSIHKSTDGGLTFPTSSGTANGTAISCPADGSTFYQNNIACSGNGTYRAQVSGSQVQISVNNGTFANVANPLSSVTRVGCSSDCTKLIAVSNGQLYGSSNQGSTWIALTSANQAWSSVWMSPDGSKIAAAINSNGGSVGGVYYGTVSALPNTSTVSAGTICGSRGSAVELQCVATDVFMPVSSTGLIWAN